MFEIADRPGSWAGDCLLDPGDEQDRRLLSNLTQQGELKFCFLSRDLERAVIRALPWPELQRRQLTRMLQRAGIEETVGAAGRQ